MTFPPKLKKGDTILLISPSSPLTADQPVEEVAASVESIQSIRQIVRDASAAGSEKPKQDGKVINENRSGERGLLT